MRSRKRSAPAPRRPEQRSHFDTPSVYYCFPRSGGTLLNKILLCHSSNVVLSEVNPAASMRDPGEQAREWFGLLDSDEAIGLSYSTYLETIRSIAERCTQRNKPLCIRDWTGVNFLSQASTVVPRPSGLLEQRLYLARMNKNLREIVLLRRSAAVYASLVKHIPGCHSLSPESFSEFYRRYLESVKGIPRFHLEALVDRPRTVIRLICRALRLHYPDGFERSFHSVNFITGNNTLPDLPASANWKTIHKNREGISDQAGPQTVFNNLDSLAGYNCNAPCHPV